jgi:hypothetical protein
MTRLPAPAWWQPVHGGTRSHRVSRWQTYRFLGADYRQAVTRCGEVVDVGIPYRGVLTDHPTLPPCRVCVPRRREEP